MSERNQEEYDQLSNEDKITVLNGELEAELALWEEMGVPDPNMIIVFNPMQISMWVKSLTKFLAEKGIIDESEFIVDFKQHMLDSLQKARMEAEPEVRRQRMKAAGIDLPEMAIPKGKIRPFND